MRNIEILGIVLPLLAYLPTEALGGVETISANMPAEIRAEDKADCRGIQADDADGLINCRYEKLRNEKRRNELIREFITSDLKHESEEYSEVEDRAPLFIESNEHWEKFSKITCESISADPNRPNSKYVMDERNSCWISLYVHYSKILIEQYRNGIEREYLRRSKLGKRTGANR